ncbi:hypothetical protein LshimejAT787_0202240 [Lyophyllum shimeji]|uniref:Uncharacterized protein n=1 Tax=Lyophyllum shimeji TaxID=47721 RepID=A0A9P3UHY5_LYOSH|nr:hypothetical protein LshimejAT787_0202240 [Lyophyllum shimeji]
MEDSAPSTVVRGTLITCNRTLRIPAVNSGVTAVTFFSIREFVVSPLLVHTLPWPQYARRRAALGVSPHPSDPPQVAEPPTISDLRKHKTLDSGLSGALTGGVLRGWKSGRKAVVPGALTVGALCTLLQLAYNEAGVIRLRYISGLNEPARATSSTSPSKSLGERFLGLFGVRQVTDEQYLVKLKATRDAHLTRIAELEQQLATEKQKAEDDSTTTSS